MIRIFVGSEEKTRLAAAVLRYSVESRTEHDIEWTIMDGDAEGFSVPEDIHGMGGTGFTFRRFLIPYQCGFEGKAIYMDADQIALRNISTLWNVDRAYPSMVGRVWWAKQSDKYAKRQLRLPGTPVGQSSVMLLDCSRWEGVTPDYLWGYIRTIAKEYDRSTARQCTLHGDRKPTLDVHEGCLVPHAERVTIPAIFNDFNSITHETVVCHYTTEGTQPWYYPEHPFAQRWIAELKAAIRAGYVTKDLFDHACKSWGKPYGPRKHNGLHPKWHGVFAEAMK